MGQCKHLGQLFSSKQLLDTYSKENIKIGEKKKAAVSAGDQFLNSGMGICTYLMNGFLEVSSIIFQGGSMVKWMLFTVFYTNDRRYWHTTFCH